jgi:hypothetical protein
MQKLIFVIFYVFFIWLLTYFLSFKFTFSTNFYQVTYDSEFVDRFYFYKNSSEKALINLKKWMKENDRRTKLFNNAIKSNLFCVGLVTKERVGFGKKYMQPNTIIESVTALLTRINLKYEDRVNIMIFNVDDNKEWKDLMSVSDVLEIVNIENPFVNLIQKTHHAKLQEMSDYATVLKYLYNKNCKYALVLEDDGIADWDWYEKTIDAVYKLNIYADQWFCLKLFTSFGSFDWLLHTRTVLKSILFIILFTVAQCPLLSFIIYFSNFTIRSKYGILSLTKKLSFSLCLNGLNFYKNLRKRDVILIVLHTVLFKIYLNCKNPMPIGVGIREFSQGYNTVANVYPRLYLNMIGLHLEQFIKSVYVDNQPNYGLFKPQDELLKKFKEENQLREFIMQPSLFQHIGIFSSLSVRDVWNMNSLQKLSFESYSFESYMKPIVFEKKYWSKK